MFENLDVFKMSYAMAVHAGEKQAVVAQNVANSDTPGFKARSLAPFSEAYQSGDARSGTQVQRATRERHLNGVGSGQSSGPMIDKESEASPNGNTVSLEAEMLKSIEAKREHDRALAIYKSALSVLRISLGR